MRILITVHTYFPNKDGVQYVTQYLAEGLASRGHDVTVITSVRDKLQASTEIYNGVRIIRVYLRARYSVFVDGKVDYLRVLKAQAQMTDVMINCCVQSPINNLVLPVLRELDCIKVLYLHGMHTFAIKSDEFKQPHYLLWHICMNLRWASFYRYHRNRFREYSWMIDIHEDSSAFRYFERIGVHTERMVIHNAVENFEGDLNDEETLSLMNEPYFLCVANFVERKNQRALIEAFDTVKKNGYRLILIGARSDYSEELKRLVVERGMLDSVVVMENVDRNLTRKYIAGCRCAVMSSLFEVYPIFLCESIMCAHPFISTRVGSVDTIPGGIVVDSVSELASKMQYAIDHEDEMKSLGLLGRSYAYAELRQDKKVAELEQLLTSIT